MRSLARGWRLANFSSCLLAIELNDSAAETVAHINERLRCCIDIIIVRGLGKRAYIVEIVFYPSAAENLRIGKLNAAGFPERRGGVSASDLTAFRIYCYDAGNFF